MKPAHRRKARFYAIQAIYDWQMSPLALNQLLARYLADSHANFDREYFERLVREYFAHSEQIDTLITPYLDRALDEVSQVELAILRMGASELRVCHDVPYRVVLNEALELTKTFSGPNSHKFINGVLDKLARDARPLEINSLK